MKFDGKPGQVGENCLEESPCNFSGIWTKALFWNRFECSSANCLAIRGPCGPRLYCWQYPSVTVCNCRNLRPSQAWVKSFIDRMLVSGSEPENVAPSCCCNHGTLEAGRFLPKKMWCLEGNFGFFKRKLSYFVLKNMSEFLKHLISQETEIFPALVVSHQASIKRL